MVSDLCSASRRETGLRRTVGWFALGALLIAATVSAVGADGQESGAKRNYLTFEVGYVGSATSTKGDRLFPRETTVEFADTFRGTIEVRPASSPAGVTWYPVGDAVQIDGSVSENSTTRSTLTGEGAVTATEIRRQTYEGYTSCAANLVNAFIAIRPDERRYDIQFTLMPDMASTMEAVLETTTREISGAPSLGGGRPIKPTQPQRVPLQMGPGQMSLPLDNYMMVAEVKGAALDADAAVLSGFQRIPVAKPADWNGPWGLALQVKWTIDLSLPPVELVVAIDGYARWRPEGSIKEPKKPGNALVARATLKSKTGTSGYVPEVKNIRFQLLDTSREPGICLNWPLNARDEDYDLRLAVESGGVLDTLEQRLEVSDPQRDEGRQPYAEARIDSYDFGGRASLRATCTLADGREIVGILKGEGGGEDLVRLPKMIRPGWIAESWRKDKGVPDLADNDDNEKVEGQQHNGDGFTLYEEYRGWVEGGKHVEGDPKRKDLFILNQIGQGGADAISGIKLFERVSKLNAHRRLLESEMSTEERLMNGNRREAPHRVKQHGVWMYNADGTGIPAAGTVGLTDEDARRAFRPGRVNHIVVETRTVRDAIFGDERSVGSYKLTERDAAFAYDRAVAHELLHAVGVDHHGEYESENEFYFVSASDPNNPSHRAGFSAQLPQISDIDLSRGPGYVYDGSELKRYELVTLIWEDTGRNIAEELAPLYEAKLAAARARRAANPPTGNEDAGSRAARFPQYGKSEFYWRETDVFDSVSYHNDEFKVDATICELGGADSGNELCLMRYYFATAYPAKDKPRTYYVVRPGQNRAGRDICHSPEGTGANAPSHQPQPRFGNSAPNRGNCFGDICPNDAIPPRNL